MLIYVALVYGWSVFLHPLGRDFSAFARGGAGLPMFVKQVFAWEIATFGASVHWYHLFNIALLYACMLLLYRLVNSVLAGPVWFGTLASTLFMANPVHSEAILNLCGVVDLLPCLLALAALVAYVTAEERPGAARTAIAIVAFALAVLPLAENIGLALVLVLHRIIRSTKRANHYDLAPYLGIALVSAYIHKGHLLSQGFGLERAFTPLYFIFYPIGFLPETARNFHDNAWVAWLAAAAAVVIAFLICRKARRPAMVFGLLSTVAIRLFQGGQTVDPVHMVGGGQLLLANALFAIALASLFYRIMENPNWRSTIVSGTTLLCVVFFALEIRVILAWRHADHEVQDFQRRAAELAAAHSRETIGVLPDYQYYLGAPMCLSQAIAWDTLFSKAIPMQPLLPMHYEKPGKLTVAVESWSADRGLVRMKGQGPARLMPWPHIVTQNGASITAGTVRLGLKDVSKEAFAVEVTPLTSPLPSLLLPAEKPQGSSAGKEPGR